MEALHMGAVTGTVTGMVLFPVRMAAMAPVLVTGFRPLDSFKL